MLNEQNTQNEVCKESYHNDTLYIRHAGLKLEEAYTKFLRLKNVKEIPAKVSENDLKEWLEDYNDEYKRAWMDLIDALIGMRIVYEDIAEKTGTAAIVSKDWFAIMYRMRQLRQTEQ